MVFTLQDARVVCEYEIYPCEENIYNDCSEIMRQNNREMPDDVHSLLNLYMELREEILR